MRWPAKTAQQEFSTIQTMMPNQARTHHPQETIQRALDFEKSGNLSSAIEYAILACAGETVPVSILAEAARIASKAREFKQAAIWYARALAIQPSRFLRFSHAVALMESGDLARAEAELRSAIDKAPREHSFLNLLGVVLKRAGRLEESLAWLVKAQRVSPKTASTWTNMGNCHVELGAPLKAAECFERATKLEPRDSENHRLLGRSLLAAGRQDQAMAAFKAALSRETKDPRIYVDMTNWYYLRKQYDDALKIVGEAFSMFPGNLAVLRSRASVLRMLGWTDEALASFKGILCTCPDEADTLVALGNLYLAEFNQSELANRIYERALAVNRNHVEALRNYCESLTNSRHGDEMVHFQRAYEVACALLDSLRNPLPVSSSLQTIFLRAADYGRYNRLGKSSELIQQWVNDLRPESFLSQLGRVETMEDRLSLVRAHRQCGDKIQAIASQHPVVRRGRRLRSAGEKIRIGIMSSDLRNHPVAYFTLPILEAYDRSRFELYCYSFHPGQADSVQQRIATLVDGFHTIADGSDHDVAQRLADDGLDILFELGGTTALNRLNVCAWRPAPIQVSWLGYMHSSGLSNIDYILVDPFIKPSADGLLIEKPFMLPETWVCLGDLGFHDIPVEPGVPEDAQGHVTFGTANNPYKFTPRCFAAWAEILKAVVGSKFLFIRPEGGAPAFRENVLKIFASHGVPADSVLFDSVRGTHMPHYNRIDIALDPFPHVGATSTCESLWMGVPVVTLVGPAFFERTSASNLHNAGLGDLCADSVSEYIAKAVELANDRERRRYLRHGLREQIRSHPLGQTERFTRNFEDVIINTVESH